jgi:hypothetical protein
MHEVKHNKDKHSFFAHTSQALQYPYEYSTNEESKHMNKRKNYTKILSQRPDILIELAKGHFSFKKTLLNLQK